MLQELQSLDAAAKKRVLVISTIIIMLIVISVWFAYCNSVVIGTAQPPSSSASSTAPAATAPAAPVVAPTSVPAQAAGPGLWQNIENAFGSVLNIFRKPSQYTIQPH